jgi:hypothetical protein
MTFIDARASAKGAGEPCRKVTNFGCGRMNDFKMGKWDAAIVVIGGVEVDSLVEDAHSIGATFSSP